jgi:hypothetical protein
MQLNAIEQYKKGWVLVIRPNYNADLNPLKL